MKLKPDEKMKEVFETTEKLKEAIECYEASVPIPESREIEKWLPRFMGNPLSRFFWNVDDDRFEDDEDRDPERDGLYLYEDCSCRYSSDSDSFEISRKKYGVNIAIHLSDRNDISEIKERIRKTIAEKTCYY